MATGRGSPSPYDLILTMDPADFENSSVKYQKATIVHEMVHIQMATTGALHNLAGHWFAEGIAEFIPGKQAFTDLQNSLTRDATYLDQLKSKDLTAGNTLEKKLLHKMQHQLLYSLVRIVVKIFQ